MIDTGFANRIQRLSDDELERQASAAYVNAYYESYGHDHEARADAVREYQMLDRERSRRREARTALHVAERPVD